MALTDRGLLMVGVATTCLQNVVYALPARTCRVTSNAAVEISTDESNWSTLTGANTVGAEAGTRFIRCTTGNALIICKPI